MAVWLCGKKLCEDYGECRQKESGPHRGEDQLGNPTNAADLAHHILKLCVTKEYGVYHCTGEGVCSWYEFTKEIVRLAGLEVSVAPCTSAEYKAAHPASADRPAWSALDNRFSALRSLQQDFGYGFEGEKHAY